MEELTQGPCRGDASECGSSVRFGPGGRAAGMVRVAKCGVNRSRSGQHVSRMAERWQVAHVWHVACQGTGAAERRVLVLHALGKLIETVARSFTPLGLAGHLSVACWMPSFFMVIGLLIYKKRDSVS